MADASRDTLVVGSRESNLAMWQTHFICDSLRAKMPQLDTTIVPIKTMGDKVLDVALSKIGDKGLFTKELENALLRGDIDIAVHSLKDMPTRLPDGCVIGAITERHNPSDALLLNVKHAGLTIDQLPEGSVIGTSSLRRIAQLKRRYPHLVFKDIRYISIHQCVELERDTSIIVVRSGRF